MFIYVLIYGTGSKPPGLNGLQRKIRHPAILGTIMFVSYFISGFIPLLPYVIFETKIAFPLSIVLSLVALFILGLVGARISKVNLLKNGLRMLLVGGAAVAIGVIVGRLLNLV